MASELLVIRRLERLEQGIRFLVSNQRRSTASNAAVRVTQPASEADLGRDHRTFERTVESPHVKVEEVVRQVPRIITQGVVQQELVVAWDVLPPVVSETRTLDTLHVGAIVPGFACPDFAIRHCESLEPGRGSRMSAADVTGVDSLTSPPVSSAPPEAFVDADRVPSQFAGSHAEAEDAASVQASQWSVALRASDGLRASEGGAQRADASRSAASDAAARLSQPGAKDARDSFMSTGAVEPRHSIGQHSEEIVQAALQGSLDEATRASELGTEPGRSSRMSIADMADVDSLAAPPMSSAVPEVLADGGHMSRRFAGGYAQPEDAASVRASHQTVALRPSEGGVQMVDASKSTASDAAARLSQPGAEGAGVPLMSTGAVEPIVSILAAKVGIAVGTIDVGESRIEPHARELSCNNSLGGSVDVGRVSCHSAGEFAPAGTAASVRASQLNVAALKASRGLATTGDARRSASSDAAARVSQPGSEGDHGHMRGLVHDVLQGSLDQAAQASELGAEPGCGFRMSAADTANIVPLAAPLAALSVAQGSTMSPWTRARMSAAALAGVDSLVAPPVSPAASEAFVDAGCVSRRSTGGYVQPEDAASVRASQQSIAGLRASVGDAQVVKVSTASPTARPISQIGTEVAAAAMVQGVPALGVATPELSDSLCQAAEAQDFPAQDVTLDGTMPKVSGSLSRAAEVSTPGVRDSPCKAAAAKGQSGHVDGLRAEALATSAGEVGRDSQQSVAPSSGDGQDAVSSAVPEAPVEAGRVSRQSAGSPELDVSPREAAAAEAQDFTDAGHPERRAAPAFDGALPAVSESEPCSMCCGTGQTICGACTFCSTGSLSRAVEVSTPGVHDSPCTAAAAKVQCSHVDRLPANLRSAESQSSRAVLREGAGRLQALKERVWSEVLQEAVAPDFYPKDRVSVRGLKARPELNGRSASLGDYIDCKRRWEVLLDEGSSLLVREENLQHLPRPWPQRP